MSTYYPKTLKRWKIQKRSLSDLQDVHQHEGKLNFSRSYIIHSFQNNHKSNLPSEPLKKERYRLDETRLKSLRLSNGVRKMKRADRIGFSKVISEDKLTKYTQAGTDCKKGERNAANNLFRMISKNKNLKGMRSQIRKKPLEKSILNDLLLIKTPNHQDGRVLETDGECAQLHQLDDEEFSPYRAKMKIQLQQSQINLSKGRKCHEQMRTCNKGQYFCSQNANFMFISQIDLKHKQKTSNKIKDRSFSVMQINTYRKNGFTRFKCHSKATEIQPWQIAADK